MAKRREKGKIPHTEWPAIRTRYAAGESLASIARDYGCTGPAIRYIVNRPMDAQGAGREALHEGARGRGAVPPAGVASGMAEAVVPAAQPEAAPGGIPDERPQPPGIDADLRWRVSSEIASFLAVFDSFLTENSPETYDQLLSATDRLMRVAARTRIELERARTSEHSRRAAVRTARSRVASA